MSATIVTSTPTSSPAPSISPGRRIWLRFRQNRNGYVSLILFLILFVISLGAELVSNDKPLVASYHGKILFPIVHDYSEKAFGGDFESPADYLDPFIQDQFRKDGNWAIYPPNHYRFDTLNYFAKQPNPAPPSAGDGRGEHPGHEGRGSGAGEDDAQVRLGEQRRQEPVEVGPAVGQDRRDLAPELGLLPDLAGGVPGPVRRELVLLGERESGRGGQCGLAAGHGRLLVAGGRQAAE